MSYFIGVFLGVTLGFGVGVKIFENEINTGYEAINLKEECQKTLPRNVECVIVAVPETEVGED